MLGYIWWYLHTPTGCVLNKASHPQLHTTLIKKDTNETRRLRRCESCDFACMESLPISRKLRKTVNLINTIGIHSPMFDDFCIYLQVLMPSLLGANTPGYDPPILEWYTHFRLSLRLWVCEIPRFQHGAQFETKWWLSDSENTMASHPWICVYIYIYISSDWIITPKWRLPTYPPSISYHKSNTFTRKCSMSPYLGDTFPETNSKKPPWKWMVGRWFISSWASAYFQGGLLLLVFRACILWMSLIHYVPRKKKQKTLSTVHWPARKRKNKKNSDTFPWNTRCLIGVHYNSHINWVVFSSTFIPSTTFRSPLVFIFSPGNLPIGPSFSSSWQLLSLPFFFRIDRWHKALVPFISKRDKLNNISHKISEINNTQHLKMWMPHLFPFPSLWHLHP